MLTFARIRSRHPTHRVLRRNKALLFKKRVVIRLGSTTAIPRGSAIEINTVEAIKNCSDKMKMKKLFKDNKVISPKYWTLDEMAKEKNLTFPIVKKLKFRSRGAGMVLIKDQKQLTEQLKKNAGNGNVYFEEFFNGSKEYRLHISELGCFYTCRKVRKEGAEERWFFNSSNSNWLLESNPKFDKPKTFDKMIEECKKGLRALGLDFGAFDVRVKKDGTFVILEANSAPSFGDLTAKKYLEHIPLIVKNKMK